MPQIYILGPKPYLEGHGDLARREIGLINLLTKLPLTLHVSPKNLIKPLNPRHHSAENHEHDHEASSKVYRA